MLVCLISNKTAVKAYKPHSQRRSLLCFIRRFLVPIKFLLLTIFLYSCGIDLKKVPHEPFIPLTKEEEAEVYCAFSGRNRYGGSVRGF